MKLFLPYSSMVGSEHDNEEWIEAGQDGIQQVVGC